MERPQRRGHGNAVSLPQNNRSTRRGFPAIAQLIVGAQQCRVLTVGTRHCRILIVGTRHCRILTVGTRHCRILMVRFRTRYRLR